MADYTLTCTADDCPEKGEAKTVPAAYKGELIVCGGCGATLQEPPKRKRTRVVAESGDPWPSPR